MKIALPTACAAMLMAIAVPVLYATQAKSHDASKPPSSKQLQTQEYTAPAPNEGERVFQRNCARCHASPEGFSSRISGAIVRHMRVRANLSQHDERELLRFFNP